MAELRAFLLTAFLSVVWGREPTPDNYPDSVAVERPLPSTLSMVSCVTPSVTVRFYEITIKGSDSDAVYRRISVSIKSLKFGSNGTTDFNATDTYKCARAVAADGLEAFSYNGSCTGYRLHTPFFKCATGEFVLYVRTDHLDDKLSVVPIVTCTAEGTVYNEGDIYEECFVCTEKGFAYADDPGNLATEVNEVNNSTRDSCCPQADDGYCAVPICGIKTALTRCQASALCFARGYQLAGREWFVNRDVYGKPYEIGADTIFFFLNIRRAEDGKFVWEPKTGCGYQYVEDDMNVPSEIGDDLLCSDVTILTSEQSLTPVKCGQGANNCVICFDPDTSLPQCE